MWMIIFSFLLVIWTAGYQTTYPSDVWLFMAQFTSPSLVNLSVFRTDTHGGTWGTGPTLNIAFAACAAGQYYTGQAAFPTSGSYCVTSSPGYYCPYGAILTQCGQCPASTYAAAGATVCTACPAGTFAMALGATSVAACLASRFQMRPNPP